MIDSLVPVALPLLALAVVVWIGVAVARIERRVDRLTRAVDALIAQRDRDADRLGEWREELRPALEREAARRLAARP